MADLTDLLARVEGATGAVASADAVPLGRILANHVAPEYGKKWADVLTFFIRATLDGSLDAAVALVNEVLPGAPWGLAEWPDRTVASLYTDGTIRSKIKTTAATPALALVAALIRAKMEVVCAARDNTASG